MKDIYHNSLNGQILMVLWADSYVQILMSNIYFLTKWADSNGNSLSNMAFLGRPEFTLQQSPNLP